MGKNRLLLMTLLAVAMPAAALAADNTGIQSNVRLAKDDHRTGTFYAAGQTVTVDGDVDGDVVCAGQTVVINGAVGGDVLCAGQSVTVNGKVGGSVRVLGQTVELNGNVGRNVTIGAQNFNLESNAAISGEAAIAAQALNLNGPIARAAFLAGNDLNLKSTIGGDLSYFSQNTPAIDKSKISGQIVRHTRPTRPEPTAAERLSALLYWVAAAVVGALLMVWLLPRLVRDVTDTMIRRLPASIGWGLAILAAMPAILAILAITFIGLPSAGVIFALWILAIMLSGILAGIAVGRLLWGEDRATRQGLALSAVAGVAMLVTIGWLPILNAVIGIASAAWALGGLALTAHQQPDLS